MYQYIRQEWRHEFCFWGAAPVFSKQAQNSSWVILPSMLSSILVKAVNIRSFSSNATIFPSIPPPGISDSSSLQTSVTVHIKQARLSSALQPSFPSLGLMVLLSLLDIRLIKLVLCLDGPCSDLIMPCSFM